MTITMIQFPMLSVGGIYKYEISLSGFCYILWQIKFCRYSFWNQLIFRKGGYFRWIKPKGLFFLVKKKDSKTEIWSLRDIWYKGDSSLLAVARNIDSIEELRVTSGWQPTRKWGFHYATRNGIWATTWMTLDKYLKLHMTI